VPNDPSRFTLNVPLDHPVRLVGPPDAPLLVETRIHANDQGNALVPWWVDAGDGIAASRVVAAGPHAEVGEVRSGFAAPVALMQRGETRLVPRIELTGLAELGGTAHLALRQSVPRTTGGWLLGSGPASAPLGPCELRLIPELFLPLRTDDYGEAFLGLPLPELPLPPPVLRLQAVVVDPAANASGMVLSELMALRPGFLP
jgi:hypothetical protein